jgi:transposase InsO family protein
MTQVEIIVNQRKNLLIYAARNGVSKACKAFGVSRTTFYKLKKQFEKTGDVTPIQKRKPKMPNETKLSKKKLLLKLVQQYPAWGPQRYSSAFKEHGIHLSPVCIWERLKNFGLNLRFQRLVYVEALKIEGKPLTETVVRYIRKQSQKVSKGLYPGHIIGLDTFYVGNLKGVGRIYQMTGIDLCSRFGWAKLYTEKGQNQSLNFVEDTLIPMFFNNGVNIESVLSDNGSEFIGGKFQGMLDAYRIEHNRIPKGKPIYNGCCERFQRTINEEFYQKAFRTKFFSSLENLQDDLNKYLAFYNFDRLHFGVMKEGAKPADVLKSKSKVLQRRFNEIVNLTC